MINIDHGMIILYTVSWQTTGLDLDNYTSKLTHYLPERKAIAANPQLLEGKKTTAGTRWMTALVKNSVARSRPLPPLRHT